MKKAEEQLLKPELPKKKWNSPISRIVCWKCKNSGGRSFEIDPETNKQIWNRGTTLYRVRDKDGNKTEDYVCAFCQWLFGQPTTPNQSRIYFMYEQPEEPKEYEYSLPGM
jgi:hypothetical protein